MKAVVNRLLENLDAVVVSSNDPAEEDRAVERLPQPLSVLYYLNWLDFEVSQGSLTAYLFNTHGRHASEAARSLRIIGADDMASVLDRAVAIVRTREAAWMERRNELEQLPTYAVTRPYRDLDGTDDLADLTDDYWTAAASDDWGDMLEEYLNGQRNEILGWAAR